MIRRHRALMHRVILALTPALAALPAAGCGDDETTSPSTTTSTTTSTPPPDPEEEPLVIHYYRPLEDYAGWALAVSGDTALPAGAPVEASRADGFGSVFTVPLARDPASVTFTVQREGVAEPGQELTAMVAEESAREVWVYSESGKLYDAAPAIPEGGTAVIYYLRPDSNYEGWGLHAWQDTTDTPTWDMPIQPAGEDAFGAFFVVNLAPAAQEVLFLLHKGDTKDPGPDMALRPGEDGRRIWVRSGDLETYSYPPEISPIDAVRAHWLTRDTIAWSLFEDDATLTAREIALRCSPTAEIHAEGQEIVGGEARPLAFDPAGLPAELKEKYPHLAAAKAFKLADADAGAAPELLKGQCIVTLTDPRTGTAVGTGLQIPGVLDDLFSYDGPLGAELAGGVPTLRLWAPTARSVSLELYSDSNPATPPAVVPMTESNGVWSVTGDASWSGRFYRYQVEVYSPSTRAIEHNEVTDPYSLSLSANSKRSQIIDLADPALEPAGWDALAKPPLAAPEDTAIYELHVRDFSIGDTSVPAAYRGTYRAFAEAGTDGMNHLSALAAAGLTHVHLLPVFDIATIPERRSDQLTPGDLTGFAADGTEQQAAIEAIKDGDGFNWGYDPYHYTVPEGSYATDPDGPLRILELRSMVKGLNEAGLRVVMDVVYNHTSASGQAPASVLDKIVPGYYHRLDERGAVATSTCCQNTATEHAMMERLMVDSLVTWATAYKIDGFRFDLMGHHMKSNMLKVRDTLAALTPAASGVDGAKIVLYGEGWDFGEVASNARGVNATQANMAGTGIGTFNDRLRDAVRGGGPFDTGDQLMKQGFASGLYYDKNALDQGTESEQLTLLLALMDQIRVGLAGNLKDYTFEGADGVTVSGADVPYNGAPTGYTLAPREAITYVSAHDNQTLFDALQYKAPEATSMDDRVRMQNLGLSIVALGQGVPFFHAGVDMLRSKSLDRDSFNSGDWFNRLDFSYASNNWGVGLPPEGVNGTNWPIMQPLLADPARRPEQADILRAVAHLQEVLRIRKSSPLFRLSTGDDVTQRVRFHNTGPSQIPGLIVMSTSDEIAALPDLDPQTEAVVILFNATRDEVTLTDPLFAASALTLHPAQQASADPVVQGAAFAAGTFTVPARTTAVFVGTASFP